MKSVSFIIELKDKVSAMVKKISGAFDELQTDVDKTQTQVQKFQSALSKLEMPNFNAMLQVAERLGAQFAGAAETGMSFGQSMADLSSITGIVGEELEGLEANSRRFLSMTLTYSAASFKASTVPVSSQAKPRPSVSTFKVPSSRYILLRSVISSCTTMTLFWQARLRSFLTLSRLKP